ncbi:E3 ubiquitin-protein ligase XIAP-like [Ruditapes philippinarum]|uniref:E3 ubiquitin-protein ligase XIAP-like n=1 Tax=Ruditapes philippinarum TaxID=129788 RepID=UPI00295C00CB|nr:E3 ubiquitin-protein ligase XIAP-like [Ruditapes philippinarum]
MTLGFKMFSKLVLCLTFYGVMILYIMSVVDKVRLPAEVNPIGAMFWAFSEQLLRNCRYGRKQRSLLLSICLILCMYIFTIWMFMNSINTSHTNRKLVLNPSFLSDRKELFRENFSLKKYSYCKYGHHSREIPLDFVVRQQCWLFPSSLERCFKEMDTGSSRSMLMRYEWKRYETFQTFPNDSPMMPTRLASNGFYYNGSEDSVTCFSCGLVYRGWKEGDSVSEVHARYSRNCLHVRGIDETNVRIHTEDSEGATGGYNNSFGIGNVNIQSDGRSSAPSGATLVQSQLHKHPDFYSYNSRLESFKDWPCRDVKEHEQLATAGFFYIGLGDCVKCFSCGGGLRNWEFYDVPWEQHAKWFNHCAFLREQKGLEFIRHHSDVRIDADEERRTIPQTNIVSGLEELRASERLAPGHHDDSSADINIAIPDKELKEPVMVEKSPALKSFEQTLGQMGFSEESIRNSFKRIEITDVTESSASRVLDDLLQNSTARDQEQVKESLNTVESTSEPVGRSKEEESSIETKNTTKNMPSELDPSALKEENERLVDQLTCKICMEKESNIVFIPCGHVVSCETCAPHIRKCAICRKLIEGRVKTYMT